MKKVDKIKRIVGILILLLIVAILSCLILIIIPNREISIKEEEKIRFDYTLYDRDGELFKDVFNKLKVELNNEEIDYEKYATYISELFVIDLYTLNNKLSKDDVGGIQFVKDDIRDNFRLNLSNTMYKYINSVDKKELPRVSNIELVKVSETTYDINDNSYVAYEVNLKWEYKEDLGYDKEGIIYVIKENDELFVVEKK